MKSEYAIYDDIWLGKQEIYEKKLSYLAFEAKREEWDFVDQEYRRQNKRFPILENYIAFTYDRLKQEKKLAYSDDGNSLCFNTGLQTEYDEDIFMFCTLNTKPQVKQKWFFVKFSKESDRDLAKFTPLPDVAHYFDNPADLLLDRRLLPIRINNDHIIDDNRERFKGLADFNPHLLRNALDSAVKQAEKRVIRNY